jgi:uncharacterized protein with HEPN domain
VIRSAHHRLADIHENIELVADLVKRRTFKHLERDLALRYAVQYAVLIVAEAVNHLPVDLRSQYPDVPWPNIIAIGHKLRHEYHRIDADIVWEVATVHLPRHGVIKRMAAAQMA